MCDDSSEVNGVEKRRRRAQGSMAAEPQTAIPSVLAENAVQEQADEQPAAPRRRRRVQPPQQITERIAKVSVPGDVPIPRLPVIDDDPKVEGKRYKAAQKKHAKTNHEDQLVKTQRREKTEKAVKACAGMGKHALEAAGGILLLTVMLLGGGAKKLGVLGKKLTAWVKDRRDRRMSGPDGGREDEPEIVVEAILPQDYHGRGAQHAAQQHGEKAVLSKFSSAQKQRLISAALVVVAVVSLFNIGSILLRTFRTTRLNAQLSERYASMGGGQSSGDEMQAFAVYEEETTQEPEPESTPEPTQEPAQQTEPQEEAKAEATPAPELVKSTKFHHMGGDALPEMEALYNENRDLVAWINIPEVIDLPVVYKDNDYYLKRDFYKQKNTAGTIFLDENHPFKEKTQNLLLHGHNMKDGTMFGRLTQYIYDRTYIKNHPFINLSTLWRKEQYVIFAVLDVSLDPKNEAFFNYFTHATFASDAEFTSYIRQLQLRSMFAIPIDVEPTDALLTLSTCLEENRLVIVARRMRPGETRQDMRNRIHTATRQ